MGHFHNSQVQTGEKGAGTGDFEVHTGAECMSTLSPAIRSLKGPALEQCRDLYSGISRTVLSVPIAQETIPPSIFHNTPRLRTSCSPELYTTLYIHTQILCVPICSTAHEVFKLTHRPIAPLMDSQSIEAEHNDNLLDHTPTPNTPLIGAQRRQSVCLRMRG